MKILISGAGIAGSTLAYWLTQYGFTPTLIEQAPQLRTGGYIIDFWGTGYDIAEHMGLLNELNKKGYLMQEVRIVNREGQRISGFSADVFVRATEGRYISLARSDLAASIYHKIAGKVETLFGDSITNIEQQKNGVRVAFKHHDEREFDLVIGADGLHSKVRELIFGPESKYEKYLGYQVAAFEAEGYQPRNELIYVMYTEVDQQVARFTLRDNKTLFLFIFKNDSLIDNIQDIREQKELLKKRYEHSGWECPQILAALDKTNTLYFDRVSQIQMHQQNGMWVKDRVALIGDAAFCISLLGGQGSALAMTAAYILAGELHHANGNYSQAFKRYENLMAPFIVKKQRMAQYFAGVFVPKSKFRLFLRNQIMKMLTIPFIANWAIGRDLLDKIELPKYDKTKKIYNSE